MHNWGVVYLGNLAGAVGLVLAFWLAGMLDAPFGATAARVAVTKANLEPVEAVLRGALCNALGCLAGGAGGVALAYRFAYDGGR